MTLLITHNLRWSWRACRCRHLGVRSTVLRSCHATRGQYGFVLGLGSTVGASVYMTLLDMGLRKPCVNTFSPTRVYTTARLHRYW